MLSKTKFAPAVDRTVGAQTRTGAVMEAIRGKLATRALAPGEKLPSIRRFAAALHVSPSTVVEAYDRLAAEGLIHARAGSGFYVSGAVPSRALLEAEPPRDRAIDPLWVSRQSLDAGPEMLKPGCGWLPADWMPNAAMRRAVRRLARAEDAVLTDYGSARGSPALRRLLVRQFAQSGIEAGADQVLLTASGTQAIDLVCRLLLRPGDTVLVDDPCYFNFQALLTAHRVRVVDVPYTPTGPDPSLFAEALAAHHPRLYVTNSALHNPTGATLSPQTAHRLLTMAAAHDLTIVEDDIFADLEPEPSPRLAALDGLQRDPHRELIENPIRLDPLRLRRGPPRLDRGAGRSPGRDELRRTEPHRDRAGHRHAHRRQLPQAPGRASPTPRQGAPRSRRETRERRHPALDHAARRLLSLVPPARQARRGRARPGRRCARTWCSRRATSSASRRPHPSSSASTWPRWSARRSSTCWQGRSPPREA